MASAASRKSSALGWESASTKKIQSPRARAAPVLRARPIWLTGSNTTCAPAPFAISAVRSVELLSHTISSDSQPRRAIPSMAARMLESEARSNRSSLNAGTTTEIFVSLAPIFIPSLGHGLRLGRIGDLNDQILDRLDRAGVARHGVQRAGRLVESLARPEPLQRTVADFHLVGAFQYIAERVAAGVTVGAAAVSGIALGPTQSHHASQHVVHRRPEELRLPGSGIGRRLRACLQRRHPLGPSRERHVGNTRREECRCATEHRVGNEAVLHGLLLARK